MRGAAVPPSPRLPGEGHVLCALLLLAVAVTPASFVRAAEGLAAESEASEPETAALGHRSPLGPTSFGPRGLLRTRSGAPFADGTILLGSTIEFSQASDFLKEGDENRRVSSRFVLVGVPLEGLELNGGFSLVTNGNSAYDPNDLVLIGDPFLGARYGRELTPWLSAAAGLQALVPNASGTFRLSPAATSFRFAAAAELRPLAALRVLLDVGYHLDRSAKIFDEPLNEAQRFAAGVNPHDQLELRLGASWDLGLAAPFLEYELAYALGAGELTIGDQPSRLIIGARGSPVDSGALHLLAAVEVGLTGVRDVPAGAARALPYNVVVGLGWDFGAPLPVRTEVREVVKVERVEVPTVVETAAPATARIRGVITDAASEAPLGGAKVTIGSDPPAVLLSDAGSGGFLFLTEHTGPTKVEISAEGYQSQSTVVLVKEGEESEVAVALQPVTGKTYGVLKGTVRNLKGRALSARIRIPTRGVKKKSRRKTGEFELELETGTFDVLISRRGYVTQRHKIKLNAGEEVILNVELYPKR